MVVVPIRNRWLIASLMVGTLALGATPALAMQVDLIKIGTWTTAPGSATQDAGLQQGGRYVIHASYDPALTPTTVRNINGMDFYVINLATAAAAIGGDSFRILVPMEGFDSGGTPFVYDQNQADHYFYGPNIQEPEIQFTAPGGSAGDFYGFEFEGDFEPGATGNFVEVFTDVAAFDPGGGNPIIFTPSQVTQVLRDPTYEIAERSIDSLTDAIAPVAEAGPDRQYNAGQTTVTTDVNAFVDNDLGAMRSDGEDFLTYDWTEGGAPLTGTTATAMRPDGRTVDDVNIAVAIENSGLTKTTDTVTWQVEVNEDLTGLGGSTDTLTVSYLNALPAIANASATAQGADLLFALDLDDPDLAVNPFIVDFEMLIASILVDGLDETAFFGALLDDAINGDTLLVSNADLLSQFGLGAHLFEVSVTDRAGAAANTSFGFDVIPSQQAPIPEPGTLALFATGAALLGAGVLRRNRRQ